MDIQIFLKLYYYLHMIVIYHVNTVCIYRFIIEQCCCNVLLYLWFVLQFLANGILVTLIGFLVLACVIGLLVSFFGVYVLSVSAIKVCISGLLLIVENYVLFQVSINVLRQI